MSNKTTIKAPSWLNTEAKKYFGQYIQQIEPSVYPLTEAHIHSIAMMAANYDLYIRSMKQLDKDGDTQVVKGTLKPHPAVQTQKTAWNSHLITMREFGLTPKSNKANQTPDNAPDELSNFLNQ